MSRDNDSQSFGLGRRLGSGKDADIFELGDAVVKLFKEGAPKHTAFREAASLAQAEALGVPVPTVLNVRQIGGRWGLAMSRVEGDSFADVMLARPAEARAHVDTMALLHMRIHSGEAVFFGSLKARLETNIRRAGVLSDARRRDLLDELASLPDGDRLCHGDFHPWNVLGPLARPAVIDWTSASKGYPTADVCRSYVLIKSILPDVATLYVETYARFSGESTDHIFRWLRVVAGARLGEGVPDEVDALLAILETPTNP